MDIKLIETGDEGRKLLGLTGDKNGPPEGHVYDAKLPLGLLMLNLAKVLAAPRVSVSFSRPTHYLIGDRPEFTAFDPTIGEFVTAAFEQGWALNVTVRPLPEGRVALRVRAAWSRLDNLISGQYPVVAERAYEHEFELAAEQAVVITGLLHDEDEVLHPAVRDTPILGTVFGRNESPHTRNREIICVLTPRLKR